MKAPAANTLERIAGALGWAEANLDRRITVADVARRAYYSPFHFHRLFTGLTGGSLMEFLRRRRMTIAAESLRASDRPILEIALDAGFDSQEAFTRAFKTFSGATPGRFRRDPVGAVASATAPLDLSTLELSTLRGGSMMEPKFVDLSAFDVVGLAGRFVVGKTEGIPALWGQFIGTWQKAGKAFPDVSYGVCYDESDGTGGEALPFSYLAAFPIGEGLETPTGLERRTLPANQYAVFTHRGPVMEIQKTYADIFGSWLPTSGYRRGEGPDFELYDERFDDKTMSGEVDIYLPVTKSA